MFVHKSDSSNIRSFWGTPASKLSLGVFLIYTFVLVTGFVLSLPLAEKNADELARNTLQDIESEFFEILNDNYYLIDSSFLTNSCENSLLELRKNVFKSTSLKEIGLFDKNGLMYCTSNNGDVSFRMYKSILERLKTSNITLSYTESKLSKEKSIVIMFVNESGDGVSGIIPPHYVLEIVKNKLKQYNLGYKVLIISRIVGGDNTKFKPINTIVAHSSKLPLSLEVFTNKNYYLAYFVQHSWLILLIASFLSIFYVYYKKRDDYKASLDYSLRDAITMGHLELYYQPIVAVKNEKVVGCEALLRWNDPIQGFISPGIFIPLAEKVGLITELTYFVLTNAVKLISAHLSYFENTYLSINISRSVILEEDFINYSIEIFESNLNISDKMIFEITEDNNFTSSELTILKNHLKILSRIGVRIAVDDFGTGYSGLNFLRQFEFSIVKIDRVFIISLSEESNVIPLLQSMKELANNLKMDVIVEGVEEKNQVEILSQLGFEYIQGFYYFKPMSEIDFKKLLTSSTK
jgi:EAL domain-containing protein (putative c-di-GMP-specific phosphodiesterase class I)